MATTDMTVKIQANDKGNPVGKLADAELHFTAGPLEGLKLIGFGIWETRGGARRNVTFPARQYAVNGERRSFALLRPIVDTAAQERIRELLLEAYAERVEVARCRADLSMEVLSVDLKKAWSGDQSQDLLLKPLDEVTVRTELKAARTVQLTG